MYKNKYKKVTKRKYSFLTQNKWKEMLKMNYGYERVSTKKQDNTRQTIQLNKLDINFKKIFVDKRTGKNANRPELKKLINIVKADDNIYVESISRFGRNVDDLRNLCKELSEKGIVVHFLKEGFSTNGDGYKFLLTILGAVAELERSRLQNVFYKALRNVN